MRFRLTGPRAAQDPHRRDWVSPVCDRNLSLPLVGRRIIRSPQFIMGDGRKSGARARFWLVALSSLLGGCNNPGATTSSDEPALSPSTAPQQSNGGTTSTGSTNNLFGFSSFTPDGLAQGLPQGGSAGSGGGSGPLGPPYGTSTACQDAIVGADEECDDGPGAALDACTSTCQTRDQPVVPAEESLGGERFLGVGRHPLSGSDSGFGISYLQIDPLLGEPQVGVSTFDIWGKPARRVIVSEGASPIDEANPVLAALPGGKYAVAWSDFDGDGSDLGVALRLVDATGELGSLTSANAQAEFSQLNPDMLWTGSELVVVWEDYSDAVNGPDLRYRRFDQNLQPLSGDSVLAASELPEAAVALAKLDGSWAAAYREGRADGLENIVVRVGEDTFRVGPVMGGPIDDRPALVALDQTHLLVAFSTDPLVSGAGGVPRIRYSVIDIESQAAPSIVPLDPQDAELFNEAQVSQLSPSVEAAPGGAYLAWRSEARPGDASGDQLWLKHLRWITTGPAPQLYDDEPELLLPRTCDEHLGDQRTPQLLSVPLPPSGALATAWTDFGRSQGDAAAKPEVVVQYAPLRLPAAATPLTVNETWPGATAPGWPAQWSSNAALPVTLTTYYGSGRFRDLEVPGTVLAWINDHTARDVDITTTVSFSHSFSQAGLFARRADDKPNNYLGVQISTDRRFVWRTYSVAPDPLTGQPVLTTLQSMPTPKGFSYSNVGLHVEHHLRFRVSTDASGAVFVGMKVWREGAAEPAAWLLSSVETPSSYVGSQLGQTAGRFGVLVDVLPSTGRKVDFDHFSAKFFEGSQGGDLDAVAPAPLLLPRAAATYRRCNAGDVSGGTACEVADGCCSMAGDCATGLACDTVSAQAFGVGSGTATCVAAHCANSLTDDGETRADCGGPDCQACNCTSALARGDSSYCTESCQCGIGDYPCLFDSQCLPGLVCGYNSGEPFGSAFGVDACVPPHCVNRVQDADETAIDCGGRCGEKCADLCSTVIGEPGHCRPYCQCGLGHGGCTNDDDCAAPLICGVQLGARYGLASDLSVCMPPHCSNNKKDATLGETRVDYGGECNSPTGLSLAEAMADFPPLVYRSVSYARDTPEYMALPTSSPPTSAVTTPTLRHANHFIFRVPSLGAVTMTFHVGDVATEDASVRVNMIDSSGVLIEAKTVPKNASTTIAFGKKAAGNYELDLVPTDDALTYSITASAANPLALKDGADMPDAGTPLYFYVPAETETGFLLGNFDLATPVNFYDPSGTAVTPLHVTDKVYAIDTHGKPGVWKTTFATTSLRAHLVNLPDVFSFDPNWVMTSQRIRADLDYGAPPSTDVTWQPLRGENRFVFRLTSSSAPAFTFAVQDSTMPPPIATVVHLLSSSGDALPGSPFSIAPQTSQLLSDGTLLPPGDYELYVAPPPSTSRYLITQPAGVSFVSVDGLNISTVWLAGYRNYFYVPPGTSSVRFAGPSATYSVYDALGTLISGQPVALGNGIYEIQSTTPGTWALNVKSSTNAANLRFLNVPQVFGYDPGTQAQTLPSLPDACSSNADCSGGDVCGTDNGARFGRASSADLCWPSSCASPPAGYCGSVLAPCGMCP